MICIMTWEGKFGTLDTHFITFLLTEVHIVLEFGLRDVNMAFIPVNECNHPYMDMDININALKND